MELAPKRPSPLWFWRPNSIIVVYIDPLGYTLSQLLASVTAESATEERKRRRMRRPVLRTEDDTMDDGVHLRELCGVGSRAMCKSRS